jgi:uncharacterized RDD family membrane protein YckC
MCQNISLFHFFSRIFTLVIIPLKKIKVMETLENTNTSNDKYAGFWLRFAALLVDRAILSAAAAFMVIPAIIIIVAIGVNLSDIKQPEDLLLQGNLLKVSMLVGIIVVLSLFNLVIGWLYYSLMESSKYSGTVGKIAVGIKVTDMYGERITFGRASGRFFAKIISNFTFLIGYIMAGVTDKKQALHDLIANCLVVKKG